MDKVDEALEWIQKICIGPNQVGPEHPLKILMSEVRRLRIERDELRAAAVDAVKAYDAHPRGFVTSDSVLKWASTTMTESIGNLRAALSRTEGKEEI